MGKRGSKAGDVRNRTHEPEEQIDIVNGLIHERPSAVERFGTFPAAFVVIRLGPPPFTSRLTERQSTESAGFHSLLQRQVGVTETRWEDRTKLNVIALACFDDFIASFDCYFERLL